MWIFDSYYKGAVHLWARDRGLVRAAAVQPPSFYIYLPVLERQRESALLRALGMQRSGLRAMLLIEAIALVAIGAVIGLLAGMFFGWLGVSSTLRMIPDGAVNLRFSLDWLYTVGLVLVCLLAAVLASILPGRRAANATPTEALAVD